jgi:hypothetical protein
MDRDATGGSFFRTFFKALRRPPDHSAASFSTPVEMLERLYRGEHPDYCLYLRPPGGGPVPNAGPLSIDLENLLAQALDPLPMITLDETAKATTDSGLPEESLLMLANKARLLCLVPTSDRRFLHRLGQIKNKGPIARAVFVMPDAHTLGAADWPAGWPAACDAIKPLGIELSGYTAGGWLFRLGPDGKACTFRPIINPNAEKIARAIESICGEMDG